LNIDVYMKLSKLIYRSLRFYKKQHLAIVIGTIISTAVLTGALIIGDSVRGSLHSLVDMRLGNAEFVMQTGDRFVTNDLADKISQDLSVKTASVLHLHGIVVHTENQKRLNKKQVLGVTNSFWELSNSAIHAPGEDEAYVSKNVADKLELKLDDELLVRVENAGAIPLNAPFVEEKESTISFRLKIKKIISDNELGRYSLLTDQKAAYNVFVNQDQLAGKLDLEGFVNTILVEKSAKISEDILNESLKNCWGLSDAGLSIRELKEENDYQVLSSRIFIDEPIAEILSGLNPSEKTLTYLVNYIRKDSVETPYSFVSAISGDRLKTNEIIVNNWLGDDLDLRKGDTLNIGYYRIGPLRQLEEKESEFIIQDEFELNTSYFQKSYMPEFPGLADAGSCSDWNTGVPIDLDKIRDKDEDYWNTFKGTPKAIISLKKGQNLWGNKYGQYTSFRYSTNDYSKPELTEKIITQLNPILLNLRFINLKSQGQVAANNAIDFGELFLSLSFFIILAGVLLGILLFTLNAASRSQETALLASLGFKKNQIVKLRLLESLFVLILGSAVGIVLGIFYNHLLLVGLNSVWQDAVKTNMIEIYIKPLSLLIGGLSGFIISSLSIYFVSRKQLKQELASLLNKQEILSREKYVKWPVWIAWNAFAVTLGLVIFSVLNGVEYHSSSFLMAGFFMLIYLLLLISQFIRNRSKAKFTKRAIPKNLAFKNLGLHHNRNMAAIILLALGSFAVIITGANRKTFHGIENDNTSGTGGYLFWAESSAAILHDLNSLEGKEKYGLDDSIFDEIEFHQIQKVEGNDASCLNLNLVHNPGILGVKTNLFQKRQAFTIVRYLNEDFKLFPWKSLNKAFGENTYPAFLDETVLKWGLLKDIGDTLFYTDEKGEQINLIIAGSLNNTIFQGHVLLSDRLIQKHYPSISGSKIMLIDGPLKKKDTIEQMLNDLFVDYGLEITSTSERLAEFNSVTNSYLSVFMMLGGLGILIGTIGLGIVLLRNLQDRKYELALLKAIGFKQKHIFRLIFSENILILFFGLSAGVIAAFVGVLPSFLSPAFNLPIGFVLILIGSILLVGFLSIFITAKSATQKNYLTHLRSE
jgi:putative ABC transport system permease protein